MSKPPAPSPEKRPTRERLTRAAVTLFQARGYHAVGLAEILAKAQAPKGSLYHHFPGGKAALGVAVIDWLKTEMISQFDAVAAKPLPPSQIAARLVDGTAVWLERSGWTQGTLFTVMSHAGPNEPVLNAAIAAAFDETNHALAAALVAGGAPQQNALRLAVTIMSGLTGCVPRARVLQSRLPLEQLGQSLETLLHAEGLT